MNILQTAVDGLVHEYSVEIPADDLTDLLEARINEVSSQVRIDGFRPGKVPASLIHKRYGDELFNELVEKQIGQAISTIIKDNNIRPALTPKIDVKTSDRTEGVALQVTVEALPNIPALDISTIEVTKPVSEPDDKDLESELKSLTYRLADMKDTEEGHAVSGEDAVLVNVTATSKNKDIDPTVLNSNERMVIMSDDVEPNFAPYLMGKKVGDTATATITLDKNFTVQDLANCKIDFALDIKKIHNVSIPNIDDDMAKKIGLESLDDLKTHIRQNMQGEIDKHAQSITKRRLLDALTEKLDFDLSPGLISQEFDSVWDVAERGLKESAERGEDPAKVDGMTEEEARIDASRIAERRLRLGLYFAHEGEQAGLKVTDQEVQQRIYQLCMNSPNPAEMYKLYEANEQLRNSVRSPIFEEKVTDLILSRIKVTENTMSASELFAIDPEAEADKPKAETHKKAKAKKTTKAKTAKSEAVPASNPSSGSEE